MRPLVIFILILVTSFTAQGQNNDVIERDYFPGARAKNSAIAAARYAQEGYFYVKFTNYISAIDSSRMYADTALFFVKRSLMLADTALFYAPAINYPAVDFLNSGKHKNLSADKTIREYYPMIDIKSHHVFGREASLNLSNSVMDFYNASLLLNAERTVPESEEDRYAVLPYDDEVTRLEADETAFQMAANAYEHEMADMEAASVKIESLIAITTNPETKRKLERDLANIYKVLEQSTTRLKDSSNRIEEIRQLLTSKHLDDVKNVEEPEHLSYFETSGSSSKIEMDKEVPDGLIYKIQLGYYPSNVDVENFHGLFPISGETVSQGLARFYAGLFYSFKDAAVGNDYIRSNAIANAFVVPFINGKKISISTAVEIERRRGIK